MNWTGCESVERIPGRVSGVSVVRGSRVQADTVIESHELGESAEKIAYSFDLSLQDAEVLLQFAKKSATAA